MIFMPPHLRGQGGFYMGTKNAPAGERATFVLIKASYSLA